MALLLNLQDIHLTFGGLPTLAGASLMLEQGDRLCLVGRNGSGKSTLLKIAAGIIEPDSGTVWLQPGPTVRYLPQEPDLAGFPTVLDYVRAGLGPTDGEQQAVQALQALGLSGDEQPARLSGGEARRAALARVMAPEPDILLLDEPTNHLDLPAIEWLQSALAQSSSTIIMISHDRRLLQELTDGTVWLDRGTTRQRDVGFARFEAWRDEVLEQEERDQQKLAQRIAAEEHWMRYGVTARRKRNMRRVELLSTLRRERREHVGQQSQVKLAASSGDLSGRLVIEAKAISKSFGDRAIVSKLDLLLLRGDRLAIVGPNGAGKTTLIRLLIGELAPDAGSVRLGANIRQVALDQSRASMRPDQLLADVITDGRGSTVTINGETRHVVSYMKDFLFSPQQARTPVSVLSGGERARLLLARELAKPSNLLVLDEPTNDLDLDTLELLEEMLADYQGTIILVSHDRDFIDRVATSVLMHEGPGKWTEYAGGYSDMVSQRGSGVEAAKPARPQQGSKPARTAAAPSKTSAKRRLSFHEKHALETLPARIAALQAEIARLEATLADSRLFADAPETFRTASERYAAAREELSASEDRWLELEVLREELEQAG
jgi:ATP-binding cassette subfamily F protein uup